MNLLFVAHGSRISKYKDDAEAFVAAWICENPTHNVALCYLELMEPSFQTALEQAEVDTYIVPLFLHEGWHLKYDISSIASSSGKQATILPPLTLAQPLILALCDRLKALSPIQGAVVIYSHGNRASEKQLHLVKLAAELQSKSGFKCVTAVAKGEPSLEDVCQNLIRSGEKNINILPHFLFAGAWQNQVNKLANTLVNHQALDVRIAEPLGHHPAMLHMIEMEISSLE